MLRFASACLALAALAAVSVAAIAGCQPSSETSRKQGVIDPNGFALVHASAAGDNHHWSVDIAMRSAAAGTYALVFSKSEPKDHAALSLSAHNEAVQCAAAHGKGCLLVSGGDADVVATTSVGPGGSGVLRAAFDVGSGGWFSIVRVSDDGTAALAMTSSKATFDVQVLSEALTKDEAPHRFTIDVVRS